jgi:acetoin utilization protein AcuB
MTRIGDHMTECIHSVGKTQTLHRAAQYMLEHRVRHLPVLHGGELVGMLSDRDIVLLEGAEGLSGDSATVEDAMSTELFTVAADAPLKGVLQTMTERGVGSCLVVDGAKLLGIYTSSDAVRMLAERI